MIKLKKIQEFLEIKLKMKNTYFQEMLILLKKFYKINKMRIKSKCLKTYKLAVKLDISLIINQEIKTNFKKPQAFSLKK